jgi:hypothetical protein
VTFGTFKFHLFIQIRIRSRYNFPMVWL